MNTMAKLSLYSKISTLYKGKWESFIGKYTTGQKLLEHPNFSSYLLQFKSFKANE